MTDRISIVGATGFLGSFVVRRLLDRSPVVLARSTSDRSVLPKDTEVREADLDFELEQDRDLISPLPFEGTTSLIYCASMGVAGRVPRVLRQLERAGVRRAVFLSTTAVFTSLPAPSRAARLEAEAAVQTSALDWTILRPTMIYGTHRDRNISRLLRFLHRFPVFPLCGNALWQPIYVEDLADAVVAALDTPATVGRVYNLPGAEPLRFAELVKTAARAVGRRVTLLPVPVAAAVLGARLTRVVTPEQIRRLAEDKAFSYAEAARDFGFAPRSFADGVTREAESLGLGLATIPSGLATKTR